MLTGRIHEEKKKKSGEHHKLYEWHKNYGGETSVHAQASKI
jgi:hypothetical protein